MIALWLLAAHLVGDFMLQTRWQAAAKLTDPEHRKRNVAAYCIPFIPLAAIYSSGPGSMLVFLVLLAVLHYATDSRRFHSTLGEWLVCKTDLPPNPWGPIPILLDQTLHIVQLAALGSIFLT